MIKFLIKGLIRDRHRSLFPVITVTIGVMITVLLYCWITGILGDFIDFNARYATGHVKIMTQAYAKNPDQSANDLALIEIHAIIDLLNQEYPNMDWVPRIKFGGILDAPDAFGETRAQGPAIGFGVDLLSGSISEIERMKIKEGLIQGRLPEQSGEILISDQFARSLNIALEDTVTLLTATMWEAMAMQNFRVAGTVRFGVEMIDRGAIIADLKDVQMALDMRDAAGEILGFSQNNIYDDKALKRMAADFNTDHTVAKDEFSPIMLTLVQQNNLDKMLKTFGNLIGQMITVFLLAMCVVLWNAGLIGGLRRYGEIGVRLAIGENKGQIYRAMIWESVAIGIFGTMLGTVIGLGFSWILQTYGISFGDAMKNATMMMPSTFRASITTPAYFIGLIPGLFATILGTALAGIGIYRRQTASLFKELEA